MTLVHLRSRFLTDSGVGVNALTVEVYDVDASGLPTGAAVTTTTTDVNGVWEVLDAAGLAHNKKYAAKIINGSQVFWIDGQDQAILDELSVATRLVLPDGGVVTTTGLKGALSVPAANEVLSSRIGTGHYLQYGNGVVGTQSAYDSKYYASLSVTFPAAFPTGVIAAFATVNGNLSWGEVATVSASGMTVHAVNTTTGQVAGATVYWAAIGY